MAASRAAEETLTTECLACEHGEDWVMNTDTPCAFITDSDLHAPVHYAEAL